eukprot:8360795-Pyramimonas_sp.AAC.1
MVLALAPRTFVVTLTTVSRIPMITYQTGRVGRIQHYAGATIMLARGVEVPKMAFLHDSGSSTRSSQVDTWRWNPENNVLACFRTFKRLSSKEAVPSMEMNRCGGLRRGSLEE